MKTIDRLDAVDSSAPGWQAGVPGLPLQDAMLMRLIRVASLGITACIDPLLRGDGLTESSYHTLIIVMASGSEGIAPTLLCEQVGQAHANMTRILFLLASDKLVTVAVDGRDGRRRKVSITPLGRRLVQKYAAKLAPSITAAMSGISDKDKRTFDRLLRALIASMGVAERTMLGKA